jgi:hypothetical protein
MELYCSECGVEFIKEPLDICPNCSTNLTDEPPIYYECLHGVPYDDELDKDCRKWGNERECNC